MSVDSSKPKKQRKFFHEMPLHKRQKSLAAHLSKGLRKVLGRRSLQLRKGDKVRVMRGEHNDFEGKVIRADYKKQRVFLEKLVRKKSDGTEKPVPLHASNLMITEIDRSDARRLSKEKKKVKGTEAGAEKPEAKPAAEKPVAKKLEKKKVEKDGKERGKKKPKKN